MFLMNLSKESMEKDEERGEGMRGGEWTQLDNKKETTEKIYEG